MKRRITSDLWLLLLTVLCAVLIAWTGFLYRQHIFKMLPLFVSLVVGILQSKANRYAPLIGSFNALLYCVVYITFKLYAQAASALLVSFPLQLVTFLRWRKNAYMQSTRFRKMGTAHWIVLGVTFVCGFAGVQLLLTAADSGFRLLDSSITLLGLAVSVLTMLAFREYTWLMLLSGALNILLYAQMLQAYPEQITYLVYSVHSFLCIIKQFFCVRKLYAEQRKEQSHENDPA